MVKVAAFLSCSGLENLSMISTAVDLIREAIPVRINPIDHGAVVGYLEKRILFFAIISRPASQGMTNCARGLLFHLG